MEKASASLTTWPGGNICLVPLSDLTVPNLQIASFSSQIRLREREGDDRDIPSWTNLAAFTTADASCFEIVSELDCDGVDVDIAS